MRVQTLERTARTQFNPTFHPDPFRYHHFYPFEIARSPRLPLQTELFLIAHDDNTGQLHIDQHQLERGLAAAVLIELTLTNRVRLGARYDARIGDWVSDPGRITVLQSGPVGDPLTDTALDEILRSGPTFRVKDFIRRFATPELYERIQGDMIASRVIKRAKRRRFLFFRRQTHVPVHEKTSVRARNKVRDLVENPPPGLDRFDPQSMALACLVTALGLTRNLYSPKTDPVELHRYLNDLLATYGDPTIHEVTAALTGGTRIHR